MSWTTALLNLYDTMADKAGNVETFNGKSLVLMPLGYDTMKAQIEITIDESGNFEGACLVDKSNPETIVPYPDRRTSGVKALPLCDKLSYVAGDLTTEVELKPEDGPERNRDRTRNDIKNCFQAYIDGLKSWCDYDKNNRQIKAVYDYVSKESVIADLKTRKILEPDKFGKFTDNCKIQGAILRNAFVRFRVFKDNMPKDYEPAVWLNKDVQKSFIDYYLSTAKETDLCFITGRRELIAKTNPVKIRGEWDTQASLISSNDDTNYTYRGRFQTKDKESGYNEALSIGYEASQKIHNALKWIIRRQGYTKDGVCIVTWESNLKALPKFYGSSLEIDASLSAQDENDDKAEETLFDEVEERTETGYLSANRINEAIESYSVKLGKNSQMCVIALDSATKGRLALTYFDELSTSKFLENIRLWQESCCWRQEYINKKKEFCRYEGVASIEEIANAVYGTEQDNRLTLPLNPDKTSPMLISAFRRLRPCIINKRNIPGDIVRTAVTKASNPIAYDKGFNYLRVLHVACSLVKKYNWEKGVKYDMKLNESCSDRSYLYGRLLAVAETVERRTYERNEKRMTNAERYMQQFSRMPMRTWEIIRKNTQIYLGKLNPGSREYYKDLYGKICSLFKEGEFELNSALDGRYLLGYDCQREALKYTAKDENTGRISDAEENNIINEEED